MIPVVAGCGIVGAAFAEEDEWVLMMAERHPAVADITELDTGERVSAIRTGGSTSLSYQSSPSHQQLFAPNDDSDFDDVIAELSGLLIDAGYEQGSDLADRDCFRIEWAPTRLIGSYLR